MARTEKTHKKDRLPEQISWAIGAAPVTACLISPPKISLTFWYRALSAWSTAKVRPSGEKLTALTEEPWLWRQRRSAPVAR